MKNSQIISLLTLLLILPVILSGCLFPSDDTSVYRGKDSELYTVAAHSMVGIYRGERMKMLYLEHDAFDRVFFACLAPCATGDDSECMALGILILQGSDKETVSYIEDCNAMVKEVSWESELTEELVDQTFSTEEIAKLKETNHWDEDWKGSVIQRQVTTKIEDPFCHDIREEAFSKISNNYWYSDDMLVTTDAKGNAIYFLREYNPDAPDGSKQGKAYFMWVNANGTVGSIEEIKDMWNPYDQLKALKLDNGWNVV